MANQYRDIYMKFLIVREGEQVQEKELSVPIPPDIFSDEDVESNRLRILVFGVSKAKDLPEGVSMGPLEPIIVLTDPS